ncbi:MULTISPECIES: transporter substrate-binding domain-containing protein [unclassified Pseudomonas]|uniref:transporter substrate-binding domain-containing protein n=1 Tax=unclassified Pseudomonas TaxID=196821 RepID=UPI002AC90FAB|nr:MULTISPECIES: transporter substrate-binding domain-containing protein [unclassified Pseudomonas]MEB0042499.1 transporter substrate-binding domain-containing protein [Pseudomonas sp. MH10]MEB0077341.1 transporter substrate-binding domain-containing protein [Pseudomonas sp. MH10out]MEB0103693.1 transporter substrate-binding domain-containing protein [Pseudomonas sp. CCI3.2]MEB0129944.1 transporter substrate-binding domain-containing protein [Pseudomonas sp. CCI2.4]MEB0159956.1 transporter sub
MKTCKKFLLAAIATLAFATGAVAADKMKMGVQAAYPPFNSKDASGQVVGFDVDIGNALCAKMKVECDVVTSDWDAIIPALNADQFNFLVSSMSITEERKQLVDFTDPYYSNKLQFIGPKAAELNIEKTTLNDTLNGKTIGAARGTVAAAWLNDNLGVGATITLYDTQADAYADLSAGNLDAVLADKFVSYEWLKSEAGASYEFKGAPVVDNDKIGIAVRKGDPLREQLNAALKDIINDGTYKKINDRYFPFSIL